METVQPEILLSQITKAALDAPIKDLGLKPRMLARHLYFKGYDCAEIAGILHEKAATVRQWKNRDNWDNLAAHQLAHEAALKKWFQLMDKDEWNSKDVRDIDLLGRQFEREAKIRKFESKEGHSGDLNPKVNNRNAAPKKPPKQNYISAEHRELLMAKIREFGFSYQKHWFANRNQRTRAIIKSRQGGVTTLLALEKLYRMLEFGYAQIFISASQRQAFSFKRKITHFVKKHTGIVLKGDPIIMNIEGIEESEDPPIFFFLGTNYETAQGYSGDVTMDEFAWIRDFERIQNAVMPCATLKKYTRTYASTASVKAHDGFKFFSGETYNKKRPKEDHVFIDLDCDGIKKGQVFGDNVWRQIVNIEDMIAGGNDLIDIDEIKAENSIETFNNLYMCQWLDDSQSAFPFELLDKCRVDSLAVWKNYKPYQLDYKKLGKVVISCDPSRSAEGDPAAICVLLKPTSDYDKWRLLEKVKVKGLSFEAIAKVVQRLTYKYDVADIVIDKNGLGVAVFDLVCKFYPTAIGTLSPPQIKSMWVMKAQSVFRNRRFEFDLSETEVATDLMSISPNATKKGQLTYESRRSGKGHGEFGWCILMALFTEPFDGDIHSNEAILMIG